MANKPNDAFDEDILDPEEMYVTLELDDGTEAECQVYTIFEVNNQDYIVLIPEDQDDIVYIYRYFEDEDGNPSLENIEDDEEYEIVADKFDEIQDDRQFDDM